MKKIWVVAISVLTLSTMAKASTADLFRIDESVVKQELWDLSAIEQIIDDHAGLTLTGLKDMLSDNALTESTFSTSDMAGILSMLEPPLGVPSFLWGCVLGWVGILIVYLVSDDKEETKRALYGCLANGAASIILYIIYVAFFVATTATI